MAPRTDTQRSTHRRRIALVLLVAVLGAGVAACGDEPAATRAASGGADERGEASSGGSTEVAGAADGAEDTGATDPQQARTAAAVDRSLDELAAIYAPVSSRLNFLVTADTLRRDAIDAGAGETELGARRGTTRVEIHRMLPLLRTARRSLAARTEPRPVVRRVQQRLVVAIDARVRALAALEDVLAATSTGDPDDAAALEDAYREAWNASLRAAREGTNSAQDLRARLGLDPAPEEAFR